MMMKVDIAALPEAVRVPAERKVLMATTGVGTFLYRQLKLHESHLDE